MKRARRIGLIIVVGILSILGAVPATAAAPTASGAAATSATAASAADSETADYVPACSTKHEVGQYSCFALRRTDVHPKALRAFTAPVNSGYAPADIQSAYNLTAAAAATTDETVYVIDAFRYDNAEADLARYRAAYGLPECSTANGCLSILNQRGIPSKTSPPPSAPVDDPGWPEETALDLDMVSATCPNCKITLIQSDDDFDNLFVAVQRATTLGAKYVSMSWGGAEYGNQGTYDTKYFAKSNVAYVASSGDYGYNDGASYPASSRNVVGVGGTKLTRNSSARGWTETAWGIDASGGATGSGCSAYTPKPAWQQIVAASTCANRAINDISAIADPDTGVAVYYGNCSDSTQAGCWTTYGGTSASAPIIASIYALAGAPASNPASSLYSRTPAVYDVTSGTNGTCSATALCTAGIGWDGPTGLGTPNGTTAFVAPTHSVTVVNPDTQISTVGAAVSLRVTAMSSPAGAALTYRATGLPAGLSMSATGVVSGKPTTVGSRTVQVTATDAADSVSSSATFTWRVAVPGTFTSVAPTRLLDTRIGLGAPKAKVAHGGTVSLKVLGRGGLPASGVSSVVLNVTATQESGIGYVTVFAGGTKRPATSNLNYMAANKTVANLVNAPVGADGTVSIYTNAASHLLADVSGYYVKGTPTVTGTYKTVTPARILDSRTGTGVAKKTVQSGTTLSVQVAGRGGVPTTGAAAVVLNVTVTNAKAAGYVTVFPSGSPKKPARPVASNLNFAAKVTVPNMVVVPIGNDGKVQLYLGGGGADVLADVSGYYLKTAKPAVSGSFVPLNPSRTVDTRNGTGGYVGRLGAGETLPVQITGRAGVPSRGVAAVALNVQAVNPTAFGYVTVFSDDLYSIPDTSNLNFAAGQTAGNVVVTPVSSAGVVDMTVVTGGQTYLVADVAGYFRS